MSSIIEGYNYDIFISYRQKDNKGDKWVSEFVEALKTELESTFKEEISVYFDENPHDRLEETHNVGKSLEGKLKCLIFIPILSQTYCDINSYAWQNELMEFIKMAENDRFGKDIRLRSGNVAGRILPIRIHDLEQDDIKLFEKSTGSVLRSLDFIFKTVTGVSRPLLSNEDHPGDNLDKTYYRDQINKVAHAIKEIITALRKLEPQGIVTAENVSEPVREKRKSKISRVVAGSILALGLIVLGTLFIPKLFKSEKLPERSIAVLPFIDDSPDKDNVHIINGVMEEILINLQRIDDLTVISRNSVEQYRGTTKPGTPEIAKNLGVNYIVEGSGQKYGNKIRLRIQLIAVSNGKERHLWGESYEREINAPEDYFIIQSQVAQAIATELHAIISPSEKQLIEKASTANLNALYFYQRGREEFVNFYITQNRVALEKAENFFHEALNNDPAYAKAYVGLAKVFWEKHYWSDYFSKNFLDSVLILANKAIAFDNQLAEAYTIRGVYYSDIGEPELAAKEINKAIKFNPNDWSSYLIKAQNPGGDLLTGIENYHKVYSLNRGSESPGYLRSLSELYLNAGFSEKARYYAREAFTLDGDSLKFHLFSGWIETWSGNYLKGLEYANKAYAMDSANLTGLHLLGHTEMFLRHYNEALFYFKKYIESQQAVGQLNLVDQEDLGFANWQSGNIVEAEEYFRKEIEYCNKATSLGRSFGNTGAYYELAAIYAIKGDRDKALKNLETFWQQQELIGVKEKIIYVQVLKGDPVFDNLRNDADFQQIVMKIESKYQSDHERVRKWLEDQGMV